MPNLEALTHEQFNWLAEKNEWRCDRCDRVIEQEEEITYYLTGYCGYCEHMHSKIMCED